MAARHDEPGSHLPAPPLASPEEEVFWGKVSAQVSRRRRVKHARHQRIAATALVLLIGLPGALYFAQRDELVPLSYRGQLEETPGEDLGIGAVGTKGRGGGAGGYGSGAGELGGEHEGRAEVVFGDFTFTSSGPPHQERIDRLMQNNRGQLRYCYESLLAHHPALAGEVSVRITVLADGTVAQAEVIHSTANNPELETCVARRISTWRFPKPWGGGEMRLIRSFRFQVTGK